MVVYTLPKTYRILSIKPPGGLILLRGGGGGAYWRGGLLIS